MKGGKCRACSKLAVIVPLRHQTINWSAHRRRSPSWCDAVKPLTLAGRPFVAHHWLTIHTPFTILDGQLAPLKPASHLCHQKVATAASSEPVPGKKPRSTAPVSPVESSADAVSRYWCNGTPTRKWIYWRPSQPCSKEMVTDLLVNQSTWYSDRD